MSGMTAALGILASLAVLVWGAGGFIRSAEAIGLRFGLSPFLLGVTVVAIGTSLPELVSGLTSVARGASEIAIGTAVGSNVANLLLVLAGATLLGKGLVIDQDLVRVDLPFLFGSALLLWLVAADGEVDALEGIVSVVSLFAYLIYAASGREEPTTTVGAAAVGMAPTPDTDAGHSASRDWFLLAISAAVTQAGAVGTVECAIGLADGLGVGNQVIAATVVAVGTSLPELVVSARSALNGKSELAVGNIVGSNVFNALGVVGGSALLGTVVVPPDVTAFALPAMLGVTVLAFFVLMEREVTRWDAWLMLGVYAAFVLQIVRAGSAGAA